MRHFTHFCVYLVQKTGLICSSGGSLQEGGNQIIQKVKFLPNVSLMLGTFRYVLSHVKNKISSINPPGKVIVLNYHVTLPVLGLGLTTNTSLVML